MDTLIALTYLHNFFFLSMVSDDVLYVCVQDLLWRSLLVYRGRINMDHCVVHHIPDGRGTPISLLLLNYTVVVIVIWRAWPLTTQV